jgi:hypothetical protein
MVRRDARTLTRRLGLIVSAAVIGATLLAGTTAAAGGKDRFQASGTVMGSADGGELRTVQDFEQAAQANPADKTNSLYSLCRKAPFNGNKSIYAPIVAPEHDVIIGDTLTTYADGTQCPNPQNEQNIVINPTNPKNIVTSSNDYRYGFGACWAYVSTDGGASWKDVVMPGWTNISGSNGVFTKTGCGGDPVMAFAPDGTLYFAALTYNLDKFPRQMSGVAVGMSTDGGLHWSAPKMVSYNATGNFFIDKEWIGVGDDGTAYVTWTTFYQGPRGLSYLKSPIMMSSSKDHGANWTSVKQVSDDAHPYNQGSQVGAYGGTLYVAYEGSTPGSGYAQDALIMATSTDGGRTFTNTEVARVYDDFSCYPIQLPGAQDRQTLTNEQFRINSFPSVAIDPTNGHIAIVWADDQGAGNCGSADPTFTGTTSNQVKLVTFNGTAWSGPRTITTGSADKVYPAVGANAGTISVGYYTRAYSPAPTESDRTCGITELDSTGAQVPPTDPARAAAGVCLDWAVKTSNDDFGAETRVSSQSSNPYIQFAGSFIGDYEGVAVDSAGNTVTVWTDFRGNPGTTAPNEDTVVAILGALGGD